MYESQVSRAGGEGISGTLRGFSRAGREIQGLRGDFRA